MKEKRKRDRMRLISCAHCGAVLDTDRLPKIEDEVLDLYVICPVCEDVISFNTGEKR